MCGKVMPFPPGHYYKDGKFVCYDDITKVKQFCYDDLEPYSLYSGRSISQSEPLRKE